MFENLKEGDAVSICWSTFPRSARRIGTDVVRRVTKTFVELSTGRKFSTKTGREIKSDSVKRIDANVFLSVENSYWDAEDKRMSDDIKMRALFMRLETAAGSRDWDSVQKAFSDLQAFLKS